MVLDAVSFCTTCHIDSTFLKHISYTYEYVNCAHTLLMLSTITSYSSASISADPSTSDSASSLLLPIGGRVCPPTSSRHYSVQLRNISQLSLGMRNTGVCGLVKYYKAPTESRGRDCYIVVHIVDESSPSIGLTCLIFNPSKEKLAIMGSVGAVAIVKGVRIESHKDTMNLQALGHEHTLVGVFSGEVSDVIPNRIGSWYDLSSEEKKRIKELRSWSKREGPLLLSSKLEEVTIGHHFNMVCQVAAMAVLEERKDAVLSVLDGTTAKLPFRELDLAKSKQPWEFDSDPELFYTYRLLTHDVWVAKIAELDVAAGDVVHMINVFSYQLPPRFSVQASTGDSPQVELRLIHCQGKIVHLEDDCQEAIRLKESLPVVHGVLPSWRAPELSNFDETEDIVHTIVNGSTPQGTLEEIRKSDIGSEYVADVEVMLISPGTLDAICVPSCPKCKGRGVDVRAENGEDLKCLKDNAILEYSLNFSLLLSDDSEDLEVIVDSKESKRLFSKVFTIKLVADQETKKKALNIFYTLTGGNDPFFALPTDPRYSYPRPTLRCAIKKVGNHPSSAGADEQSCNYYLVNTVIDNVRAV